MSSEITTSAVHCTPIIFIPAGVPLGRLLRYTAQRRLICNLKTSIFRRILTYLVTANEKAISDPGFLSSYFPGVRGRGGTSVKELVSPSTEPNTLAVRRVTLPKLSRRRRGTATPADCKADQSQISLRCQLYSPPTLSTYCSYDDLNPSSYAYADSLSA